LAQPYLGVSQMTRTAITLALCTITFVVLLGFAGCQPAANQNTSSAPAEPTKEPFNPAAIEAEVLKLDREWANVMKTRDVEAMRRIEADDIIITYPDGLTGTKGDDIRDIESGAITAESYEVVDAKVKVLNQETAVVTGRGVMKKGVYKRPNAKPLDISGEYRFTDVFAKRNGVWQVVASQVTKIDPDAVAAAAKAAASPGPSPATSASQATSPSPSTSPSPRASRTP
jgi:ketosteroid isomerase-like protein